MILMIDNYDSFVYNLVRYFNEVNEEVLVYRNDKLTIDDIRRINPEGIVISPGPKNPKEAGISMDIIRTFKGEIPILGICLGHQCIGEVFGGQVIRGVKPMHGKVSQIKHNGEGVFKTLNNPLMVTRYHSLEINREKIPEGIKVTSTTMDGVVMGIEHELYKIYGVQFHPEAELTEQGHELIKNFIRVCKGEEGNDKRN